MKNQKRGRRGGIGKRGILFLLIFSALLRLPFSLAVCADGTKEDVMPASGAALPTGAELPFDAEAKSVILMEAATGTVLCEKNADEALPPASVTKVMTLLLVMEAIDGGTLSLDTPVSVSEYAASMGGSQVYLEPGETMPVSDLLKSVVVASANDAAVALAEQVSGSVEAFVTRMNERAAELGMKNTHFENPTGLDDNVTNHLTSARDIALMSRALMKHETIFQYTTIWMDSIRNGAFGLTNTNRLIRFYNGANGLKTGSTSKAKFCISATAKRDGMQLIAVIMGAPSRDDRNETAKKLLDYGFAHYRFLSYEGGEIGPATVKGGEKDSVMLRYEGTEAVVPKSGEATETKTDVPSELKAPLKVGESVGKVTFLLGETVIGEAPVTVTEEIPRIGYGAILLRLFRAFFFA